MRYAVLTATLALVCGLAPAASAQDAPFEEAVIDVGNVGVTVTNAGFIGKASVRNNPAGPPSFEYPLNSGVEHLFEAGLWIGAIRQDGRVTVRSGAVTSSGGYQPGAAGYELAQTSSIVERSTLLTSDAYNRASAVSHQDFVTSFTDTAFVLPGTQIQMPDPAGALGADVTMETYAWNFPFTEYFTILHFNIVNVSAAPWDSVYVGLYHDLVVRNVLTTTDEGTPFFSKGGYGFVDSLQASYAFNAGGEEETVNTYGAVAVLGAEWVNPATGETWFFHPEVADRYTQAGFAPPAVNFRWWKFSGETADLTRPTTDEDQYDRMARPYPNPAAYPSEAAYESALSAFRARLRTEGLTGAGNWIGLTPIGPFPSVAPGDTVKVTFALVGALKPEEYQGPGGKPVDDELSRSILVNNVEWARRTYAGEDANYNGVLDPGEDVPDTTGASNGVLDRYRIPEPPRSPNLRIELEQGKAVLYWDRFAEQSKDPVTGELDFEGYRVYRSNPGDDLTGNLLGRLSLIAQYDSAGNQTGFNNGFGEILLDEPRRFPGDPAEYAYRFESEGLLSGWQYAFSVTAFDEGEATAGLESFESSRTGALLRVFPGTPADSLGRQAVGVYPNPFRVNAAWDGPTAQTRRLNFYNLPPRAEVRIYTLAGEIVDEFLHEAGVSQGDIAWYRDYSTEDRQMASGEYSWDLLSQNGLNLAAGLYLFTVRDLESGEVQTGKFVILR